MKCTNCEYYLKGIKYCKALRQQVNKKKSCWAFKDKGSIADQALKFLRKE